MRGRQPHAGVGEHRAGGSALLAGASLNTQLRTPTASQRLRETKHTRVGLSRKNGSFQGLEKVLYLKRKNRNVESSWCLSGARYFQPHREAGGEPPAPHPPPPGSGRAAGQALCNRDAAEGRAEERTRGQGLCRGGRGGQSSEFPASVWPFLGRCGRSGLAPPSPHPISSYLVIPPGPRGLSCRESESFPEPPPAACIPACATLFPRQTASHLRSLSSPDPHRQSEGQRPVVRRPPHPPFPSKKRGRRQ